MNCFWSRQQLNVQFLFYIASDAAAAVALLQVRSFFHNNKHDDVDDDCESGFSALSTFFYTFTSWFLSALIYTRILCIWLYVESIQRIFFSRLLKYLEII